MEILKRQEGSSLIEALVAIVILGLIAGFSVMVIQGLYGHPRALLKGEGCRLAETEISRAMAISDSHDTSYTNPAGILLVSRRTSRVDSLQRIEVRVTYKPTGEEVATLAVYEYR